MAAPEKTDSATTTPTTSPATEAPKVPITSDVEASLRSELAQLKGALRIEEQKSAALEQLLDDKEATEKAKAAAAKKGIDGPTCPYALVPILGEGRRMVERGKSLTASEIEGLTEGVHFEMR